MEKNSERSCESLHVLLVAQKAQGWYAPALGVASEKVYSLASKTVLGGDGATVNSSSSSIAGQSSFEKRRLELPTDSTVSQARRCFGFSIPGDAHLLASDEVTASFTSGEKLEKLKLPGLAEDTPLWQLSQGCKVTLGFPTTPGETPGKALLRTLKGYYAMVTQTWSEYKDADAFK
eukprot:TRINITY_DN5462_c0_g1_i1.p1 TRINITY_DN5462_c0_g1~~TRINITY_DN5462_c0_g1_i1.p1  ORF type:complete len:195 (+),score=51.03 TRINITY_DN5462_c0_g1_i1:59-586(+)